MALTVRLPREVEQRLQALAGRTGRSKASYAREAIVRYLEDLEDGQLSLRSVQRGRAQERECQGNDPFGDFDEWASDADTFGYAALGLANGPEQN
jgi:RHH-type rel operon transcriptional repressor/antitoxin RelB